MSPLFWFRPVFMALLIVAEGFFCVKLKKRKGFSWKLAVCVAACIGLAFAIPYKIDNAFYSSFMFLILYAFTFISAFVLFDEPLKNILFCTMMGYTVQHIASEFCEIFNTVMVCFSKYHIDIYDIYTPAQVDSGSIMMITVYAVIYAFVYIIALKSIAPKVEKYKVLQTGNRVVLSLFALIVLIDIVLSSLITYLLPYSTLAPIGRMPTFGVFLLLHGYNILCCVLAVILTIELPRRSGAEYDLKLIRRLNIEKQEQYEAAKINMELINMKCHDLKHRMLGIVGDRADEQEKSEIRDMINIYDSAYNTKNQALNVVLSEKGLICKRDNINLSVIADAERLSFMRETDVYALFGNLLDNAIEAVRNMESGRSIGLNIKTANSFLIINVFNEFAGEIKLIDGLPQTTKRDKSQHGYGLKSVRYIADKYDGEMSISIKDNVFSLTIAFAVNDNP